MQSTPPVRAGDTLAGKYLVERVLGEGGMGIVVAARHIQLGQRVALKFMRAEVLGNAEAVARFLREARSAVQLTSQHVARILDVGTLETGSPYIVMEYLDGKDVSHHIAERGRLSANEAADICLQASDAIAEAHSLGIIHRDLKPPNLYLAKQAGETVVKVLDFGISKANGMDAGMTRTTSILGSPAYMSPEQLRSSKSVDARSDIWSLGVILYEAVSGRVPFHAEQFTELAIKILMDPAPPLALGVALPPGFEAVVMRCLAKEPAQRYASVADLAEALAPYATAKSRPLAEKIRAMLGGVATAPPPVTPAHTPVPAAMSMPTADLTGPQDVHAPRAKPKSSAPLIIGIVAVVAIGAVAALMMGGSNKKTEETATAPPAAPSAPAETAKAAPAVTKTVAAPRPAPAEHKPAPKPVPLPVEQGFVLDTEPRGARVRLDGQELGVSPLVAASAPGKHTLELDGVDGYFGAKQELETQAAAVAILRVELVAAAGTSPGNGGFRLTTVPAAAPARLDGKALDDPSVNTANLPPGKHTLEVDGPTGFLPAKRDLDVQAGVIELLNVELERAPTPPSGHPATLDIASTPPGATVRVDGKVAGKTPTKVPCEPGSHVVELSGVAGYFTTTQELTFKPGEGLKLTVPLDKQALPPPVQKPVAPVIVKAAKPPKPASGTRRPANPDDSDVAPNDNSDLPKLVLPERDVPAPAPDKK